VGAKLKRRIRHQHDQRQAGSVHRLRDCLAILLGSLTERDFRQQRGARGPIPALRVHQVRDEREDRGRTGRLDRALVRDLALEIEQRMSTSIGALRAERGERFIDPVAGPYAVLSFAHDTCFFVFAIARPQPTPPVGRPEACALLPQARRYMPLFAQLSTGSRSICL